MYILVLVFSEF